MDNKIPFSKPSLDFKKQADLLCARGLVCADKQKLINSLRHYNYYRLSGYCLAFEEKRHHFLPGVKFEDIETAYEFDRKLRKILMESLELIEIQLRTSIAYCLAQKYGAFAHENKHNLFLSSDEFEKWVNTIHTVADESKEIFVKSFRKKYANFPSLPIWMLVEILPFGSLSHLFSYLKKDDAWCISKQFNMPLTLFKNWLHVFAHLRNICAHHSRLFDRTLSIQPKSFRSDPTQFPPEKIICSLLAIRTILRNACFPQEIVQDWIRKIEDLFTTPPHIPNFYQKTGSPVLKEQWLYCSLWK